jgi:hypothetical protein
MPKSYLHDRRDRHEGPRSRAAPLRGGGRHDLQLSACGLPERSSNTSPPSDTTATTR